MFHLLPVALSCAILAGCSRAQQYPPPVTYNTVLKSPVNPNITISYKQPSADTCATPFDTQKQYTGYVNLPPFTLMPYQQNYSINTFFWFFESRTNPESAPLTIWLNGGPGSSSMVGLFQELGPCEVVRLPNGSYGTQSRPWGWDRSSNLLFIDQPTQTGFSYDERVNASVDFKADYPFELPNRLASQHLPANTPSWRFKNGTFASGRESNTQDSTAIAARSCWHFLQGFLSAFPQYNPGSRPNSTSIKPTGVNLFAESYGGIYGPTFADFFEEQNDQRKTGVVPAGTLEIQLESVGIVNGILDHLLQTLAVAAFTYSNNYGIGAIDLVTFQNVISYANSDTGCRGLVAQCRSRIAATDRGSFGRNEDIDQLCEDALKACNLAAARAYATAGRSVYDIRVKPEVGPSDAYQEYLNSAHVLMSIGAQVNFTQSSKAVFDAFSDTGDSVRGTQLSSLAELLARGVRVAFIYGDADIICNWYGGQHAALELAHRLPGYSDSFLRAGYADIIVNNSYVGGQVRQYGNLSFSRIYDAGHLVPYYQPETAFTVFTRIIQGDDIGMGKKVDLSTFGTKGPAKSLYLNKKPYAPASTCWLRSARYTCTEEERMAIKRGEGIVRDGIWVLADDTSTETTSKNDPAIVVTRSTTTSSMRLTGVYTATGTPIAPPTSRSGSSRRVSPHIRLPRRAVTPYDPAQAERDAKQSQKTRNGLAGGLAAVGALLLAILSTLLCCRCCRRRKNKDRTLPDDTEKSPAFIAPPDREVQPVVSRHPTIMDPIPEASPRPSKDTVPAQRSASLASKLSRRPTVFSSSRPSETTLKPLTPPEADPIAPVQSSVPAHSEPPTYTPSDIPNPSPVPLQGSEAVHKPEAITPTLRMRSVSQTPPEQEQSIASTPPGPGPVPTPLETPKATPTPSPPESDSSFEPATEAMQRSASLWPEEPQRVPTAPLLEPNGEAGLEPASRKPSLVDRVKSTSHYTGEDKENAAEGPIPERDPTPPPRVATQPPPSRAPTAPMPSGAVEA
ncbi:Nn.00g047530.m01.CDS01 [Neocucurbitaria sp. VM-36]